jgi:hypothetical protein
MNSGIWGEATIEMGLAGWGAGIALMLTVQKNFTRKFPFPSIVTVGYVPVTGYAEGVSDDVPVVRVSDAAFVFRQRIPRDKLRPR